MADYLMIVSNPPHNDVDASRAAACFGLTAAEVRMKANYPVPEIWLAGTDRGRMADAERRLGEAGLNVVLVEGQDLLDVPPQGIVKSFSFTPRALLARVDGTDVEFGYDDPIMAVFCQPSAEEFADRTEPARDSLSKRLSHGGTFVGGLGRRSHSSGAAALGMSPHPSFLDIYATTRTATSRVSFVENVVEFLGLGDLELPRATDNMVMLVAELEDRFARARIDRRLMGMRLREGRTVADVTPHEPLRQGFSYATKALSQLLESISPALKVITHPELTARLAYLTKC